MSHVLVPGHRGHLTTIDHVDLAGVRAQDEDHAQLGPQDHRGAIQEVDGLLRVFDPLRQTNDRCVDQHFVLADFAARQSLDDLHVLNRHDPLRTADHVGLRHPIGRRAFGRVLLSVEPHE